ncbi:MAG: hypothetical protein DRI24_22465 [Deltaproteobacteria bacterium]|nr:MAG: hypothetical protein DRI24_22465 [Deltaproteobacteria bacterium]
MIGDEIFTRIAGISYDAEDFRVDMGNFWLPVAVGGVNIIAFFERNSAVEIFRKMGVQPIEVEDMWGVRIHFRVVSKTKLTLKGDVELTFESNEQVEKDEIIYDFFPFELIEMQE